MKTRPILIALLAACAMSVCLNGGRLAAAEIGFPLLATLDIGQAPHQISFSAEGKYAFVASAGSDWIAEVDAVNFSLLRKIPAPNVPLGVVPLADGRSLAVSQFAGDALRRIELQQQRETGRLDVGGAASLFSGPLPGNRWLIVSEKSNRLSIFDANRFEILARYDTGNRPFPAAATADGRKAFVPNYDEGTVSVIDLWNGHVVADIAVGPHPSGGVVLPGGNNYAVAVRGENSVKLINTASHEIVAVISEGIGQQPFSVVTGTDDRWAWVNNTASHDVSVIDLASNRVTAHFSVPKIPIVMAVHPSGRTLWVASEGDNLLTVYAIPDMPPKAMPLNEDAAATQVWVMGMIHGRHLSSKRWGLREVRQTIRNINPDVVCAEIPPANWATAWPAFQKTAQVTDDRIRRFPEYVKVLLPLQAEMGFVIEPCAAWTREMALLRKTRLAAWDNQDRYADSREAYAQALTALQTAGAMDIDTVDDPRIIHSVAYDLAVEAELSLYDRYQNDYLGPGGWSNINAAHFALIKSAIERHRGERILITFGAGHKYWFLQHLRRQSNIQLMDMQRFLPPPRN